MSVNTVKVTVQVPRGVDRLMRRIATLEGSTVEAWYEWWLRMEFNMWIEELQLVPDIDIKAIVKRNGLESYLQAEYPGFLQRAYK